MSAKPFGSHRKMPKKIKTEMKGDTSRHGPRADAKRIANKVRRAIDYAEAAADTLSDQAKAVVDAAVRGDRAWLEALRK